MSNISKPEPSTTIAQIIADLSFTELEQLKNVAAERQAELKTSGLQEIVASFEEACMTEFGMTARQTLRAAEKLKNKERRKRGSKPGNEEVH